MLQCPGAAEWRERISRPIDGRLSYRTGCERTRVSVRHGERFPSLRVAAKAGALWAKREIAKTGELDRFAPFQPFLIIATSNATISRPLPGSIRRTETGAR